MRTTLALVLTCVTALSATGAEIAIPAQNMSGADKRVNRADARFQGLAVCNGKGGYEEWAANIKQSGLYYVHFRYCSGDPRPCSLTVNGKPYGKDVLGETTGGFLVPNLAWATVGPFELGKGSNKIRLSATQCMPHFLGLIVSTDKAPPKADLLREASSAKRGVEAKKPRKPKAPKPSFPPMEEVAPEAVEANRKALQQLMPDVREVLFIKRMSYNSNHYYTEYLNSKWQPGGNLCALSLADGSVREIVPQLAGGVFGRFDLSFDAKRVVFCYKKAALEGYRLYEVNVDGSGLRQITFPPKNEQMLIERYKLSGGYHHGTDDMHPCYLPDGGIAFISTRCQYGILCNGPDDFTTTVVYRVEADGSDMCKLSNSSVSEASPVLLPDGRIMYTRWEYFDKGAVSVKCLWAMRPDGSASEEIYANDISLPPTFIFGRPIPGAPNEYVVMGTPHYPQAGVGTVIRLDMTRDIRTREPMTYMTPYVDIRAEGGFDFRTGDGQWTRDRSGRGPLFRDPYPLSPQHFLVAHKPAGPPWTDPTSYDLHLLDEAGNVSLFYRDKGISCWQPMPLRPRETPPVLRSSIDPELAAKNQAVCVVADVYRGLDGVQRGQIKYIRILEQMPRPWASRRRWGGDLYDQQHVCITKDTHLALKVQHGVVPVEDDGSAHFVVPAKGNVSFQVLDENYMSVQTERTYVYFVPGERRSCVGCHEIPTKELNAPSHPTAKALRRPPSVPGPQPGEKSGRRPIDYATDVQPVLDKHCVKCHSGDEPKASLDLSGTETTLFSRSYESLVPERRGGKGRRGAPLLGPIIGENHPKTGNVHYLPPRSLGSHASVLVSMLSKSKVKLADPEQAKLAAKLAEVHKERDLSPAELLKITNWVDTNAQFYGSWYGRRHIQHKDHPNFRPTPTFDAAISTTPPIPEEER